MVRTKNKSEVMSLVLLLAGFLLLGLTSAKLVGYVLHPGSTDYVSAENSAADVSSRENLKKYQEESKKVTSALKKKNLFYELPKKPEPPSSCQAIFGDEAYIDGKWFKVGATLRAGAKLKTIEATYIIIEHEGKEKKLAPIAVAVSSGSKTVKPKGSESKRVSSATMVGKKNVCKLGRENKQREYPDWARKMSLDELRGVRGEIEEYIEGLREKGVEDPEQYEGALKKMETVEDAMWDKENSK
jgi:hypothetical protein